MADALGLASFGSRHCEATGRPTATLRTGANFDITRPTRQHRLIHDGPLRRRRVNT